MNFFPGSDRIIEDGIELFGLADALFVSKEAQGHLSTRSYLAKGFEENGRRLIIEKLLSIAIKLRFLDDKSNLLEAHDRSNAGIVTGKSGEKEVGLREALNKIIHHESIQIFAKPSKITVTDQNTQFPAEEIQIAEGTYPGFSIFVCAEGKEKNKNWVFQTELTHLINEILRVFYFENLKNGGANNA